MKLLFIPIFDYLRTRKRIAVRLLLTAIPALLILAYGLFFNVRQGIDISSVFSNFVNVQISASAILISFSIAVMTILVSADNTNIVRLKNTDNTSDKIKPLDGKPLSLYQVLLSNITYNVLVEIAYLIILIAFVFLQMILPVCGIKYLTAICVFFIAHILHILIESVAQMYLTFWK